MRRREKDSQNEYKRVEQLVAHYEQEKASGYTPYLDSEDVEDIFNFYMEMHLLAAAKEIMEYGKRLHPDDEVLSLLQARWLIENEEPQKGLQWLEKNPIVDDYYWHYLRLAALADLKNWVEADKEAKEALHYGQYSLDAVLDVGNVFYFRDEFARALDIFIKSYNGANTDGHLLYRLAYCNRELGKTDKALHYIDQLIDQNPYRTEAWMARISLHAAEDKFDEALDDFEYLIAIEPENELYPIGKIRMLSSIGRDKEALQAIEDLEQQLPKTKNLCYSLRADLAFYQADYKKAHKLYNKGFSEEQFLADCALRFLRCKITLHRWKSAINFGKFLLTVIPEEDELMEMMADCYYAVGDLKEASQMLNRLLKLRPDNTEYWLRYGSLLLDLNNYKAAYSAFRKSHRLNPEGVMPNVMMAVMSFLKDDFGNMYRHLTVARKKDPAALGAFLKICPQSGKMIDKLDEIVKEYEKSGYKHPLEKALKLLK